MSSSHYVKKYCCLTQALNCPSLHELLPLNRTNAKSPPSYQLMQGHVSHEKTYIPIEGTIEAYNKLKI